MNSDQTVNEQHRQQLTNLRLEIEQRKDKEKMFELERLRLEKDKLVQEIETKAKLQVSSSDILIAESPIICLINCLAANFN